MYVRNRVGTIRFRNSCILLETVVLCRYTAIFFTFNSEYFDAVWIDFRTFESLNDLKIYNLGNFYLNRFHELTIYWIAIELEPPAKYRLYKQVETEVLHEGYQGIER